LEVLQRAKAIASIFGSQLTTMSAIPHPWTGSESTQKVRCETLSNIRKIQMELRIQARVDVYEGSPGEVVAQAVATDEADLIVIGHGRLADSAGHLRTHAYDIIWNAPVPVMVV
jgi:nucleotide-binding universal stress UspA family protein